MIYPGRQSQLTNSRLRDARNSPTLCVLDGRVSVFRQYTI